MAMSALPITATVSNVTQLTSNGFSTDQMTNYKNGNE